MSLKTKNDQLFSPTAIKEGALTSTKPPFPYTL